MTEQLENALRRTLKDAAERAPKAPPGIGLAPRTQRVRRGPSRTLLAAAAVVVAIAGTTVGVHAVLNDPSHRTAVKKHVTAAPSPALHRLKRTKAPPIEKVWPGVAFRVPKTLTNGKVFHPQAIIDDHTIAVTTDASFEKADAVYAYDLKSHRARQITTIVTPPKAKLFASGFTAGGGYVAWWLDDGTRAEIWAAPISGGPARLVAQAGARGLSRLSIDGKDAVWSLNLVGGVYRAPLAGGGTTQMVPGSASMHILMWPWIGTPPAQFHTGSISDNFGVKFAHVKNAVTGETRSAHLTDRAMWQCGPTWCVGADDHFTSEAQRRDGSGRRSIPDISADVFEMIPPILDRFVVYSSRGTIYDLRTGKSGDLRIGGSKSLGSIPPIDPSSRLYWGLTNDGYVIVNLGGIG